MTEQPSDFTEEDMDVEVVDPSQVDADAIEVTDDEQD